MLTPQELRERATKKLDTIFTDAQSTIEQAVVAAADSGRFCCNELSIVDGVLVEDRIIKWVHGCGFRCSGFLTDNNLVLDINWLPSK